MAAFLDICRFTPTAGGTTDWTYSIAVTGYQSPASANAVNGRVYKFRAESTDLSQWELAEGAYNSGTGTFARTTVLFNSSGTGTAAGQSGAGSKISFTTVPQVAIVALKEDLLSIEEANTFTAPQQAQGRSNIYAAPFDAMAFCGMQINGGVEVSQELGTTGATLVSGAAKYIADYVQAQYVHGANTAVITSAQFAAASFPSPLSGYPFGHQIKAATALTSPANGDYALHRFIIEGYRVARLGFGAAGAQPFSYGIQFYSTVSGTIFLKFSNSTYARCFYQEQTVAAGWNWLTGTVTGDTTGTWQAGAAVGMYVEVFAAGKAASPAAPGAWGVTNTTQTTNSTNLLVTNNNQTVITGFIHIPGSEVPNSARAPFIMRPFDQELLSCMRCWEKTYDYGVAPGTISTVGEEASVVVTSSALLTTGGGGARFKVTKRALPTVVTYSGATGVSGKCRDNQNNVDTIPTLDHIGTTGFRWIAPLSVTSAANAMFMHWIADARM